MLWRLGCLGLLCGLLAATPARAEKEISVDWDSGRVTVREQRAPSIPEPRPERPDPAACRAELKRLRTVVRAQQAVILRQHEQLRALREQVRHQEGVIRGLDMLRRQGR
jgi:hypothetical protein